MNTTNKLCHIFFLLIFLFSCVPIRTAQAATLIVTNTNDSGPGSLRQIISDASIGDTITFDANLSGSTITLASTLILDKNLTIDGSSLALPISISGDSAVRVFYIDTGVTVTLDNLIITKGVSSIHGGGIEVLGRLTVRNSTFSDNSAAYEGGAIRAGNYDVLEIINCTFSNNSATDGGGIWNYGHLNLENSTFSGNSASLNGGAVYTNTTDRLTGNNSTFSSNSAEYGGAIHNQGEMVITNSTFSQNKSNENGGAIFNNYEMEIIDSSFSNNLAHTFGGGIMNEGTLHMDNCSFSDNLAFSDGGAIRNERDLNMENCSFSRNTSGRYGGGIMNEGTVDLDNCTFSNNSADFSGGGIENRASLTVNNSSFTGNSASRYFGGGINNRGTLIINTSSFSGNSTYHGGAIMSFDFLRVTNSSFLGNSARDYGGALANDNAMTVINSTFSGNAGEAGGAIFNSNHGTLDVENSTITGNSAIIHAGGIYNTYLLTVNNSTFSNNDNGSLYNQAGSLNLSNTILANSPTGFDCYNALGGVISTNSHNLMETQWRCGTPAYIADPFLAPLADNGGLTQTMALLPGSIAINAGDNATCTGTDQRGITRPLGGTCDIGAYEAGASILNVISSTPGNNASPSNLSNITITFSEDALHDGSNRAANYVDNYLLVEPGVNGTFDTLSCAEGLQSDDTRIPINAISYNSSTFSSRLTLDSELPNGRYRLYVCGTTSIWSTAGLELNNGANDVLINFSIITPSVLPATGFPMGLKTDLSAQPQSQAYSINDITLEIPPLKVTANIVGVPFLDDTWDVSWLANNVGWLEGSAAPTWAGNTVITGHVWEADNQPGIFADLKSLKYGDQFSIQAWGQTYTYEVRQNKLVTNENIKTVMQHEELDWITLVTCEGYNPTTKTYSFRRVVRAVLVQVE